MIWFFESLFIHLFISLFVLWQGGMRAVIWTDVFQFTIMAGGLIVIFIVVSQLHNFVLFSYRYYLKSPSKSDIALFFEPLRQAWGEYWTKVLEYKYKYLKKWRVQYKYKYWIFKSTWVQVQVL